MSAARMRPSPCVTCGKRRVLNYERQCQPCGESALAARQYAQACGSWQSVESPDSATGERRSGTEPVLRQCSMTTPSEFRSSEESPSPMTTVEEIFKFARAMDIHTAGTLRMISKCARSSQGAALENREGCVELTSSEASPLVEFGIVVRSSTIIPEPYDSLAASTYSLTSYGLSVIGALRILQKL